MVSIRVDHRHVANVMINVNFHARIKGRRARCGARERVLNGGTQVARVRDRLMQLGEDCRLLGEAFSRGRLAW